MSVVHGYATTEELEEWNTAATPPTLLVRERAINAASRAIDQYCHRHFYQDGTVASPVARTFPSPCDLRCLELGAFNDLASPTLTLKTDAAGDGTFETTWSASDYELLPVSPASGPELQPYTSIRSTGTLLFPVVTSTGKTARVEITGIWGWPAVPNSVNQACLLLAARLFSRKESPQGVAGFGEFGQIRVAPNDRDVTALLDPYRRVAVLVA